MKITILWTRNSFLILFCSIPIFFLSLGLKNNLSQTNKKLRETYILKEKSVIIKPRLKTDYEKINNTLLFVLHS